MTNPQLDLFEAAVEPSAVDDVWRPDWIVEPTPAQRLSLAASGIECVAISELDAWAETLGGWDRVAALASIAEEKESWRRAATRAATIAPPLGPRAERLAAAAIRRTRDLRRPPLDTETALEKIEWKKRVRNKLCPK